VHKMMGITATVTVTVIKLDVVSGRGMFITANCMLFMYLNVG
jgi:hypothetical protein